MRGLIVWVAMLAVISGCRQSITLPQAPSAWRQAILNDARFTGRVEAQVEIPHAERLPALLEVYRPHPDYLEIVERSVESCLIGGKEYHPATYLTATECIRWLPLQRRCIIIPRMPGKQAENAIQQLFERNVRLREVERAEWQGKQWTVVSAWVEGGYQRKHYWISGQSTPYVGRIQTYNSQGVLIRDEQRYRYQPLPASTMAPTPPTPPPDWKLERPVQLAPLDPKLGFKLSRYQPPKGYEQVMIVKRSCPCNGAHFAIGALYSNGLDCFTLFLLPAECPDAQRADGQLRIRQQSEGVVATVRLPDGRALLLVGEIQPQQAAQMLSAR